MCEWFAQFYLYVMFFLTQKVKVGLEKSFKYVYLPTDLTDLYRFNTLIYNTIDGVTSVVRFLHPG